MTDSTLPMSTTTDKEYRQALSLTAYDALANTPQPTKKQMAALKLLLRRLARPAEFTTQEEGEWIKFLLDADWTLTSSYDPERWKAAIRSAP